MQMRHRGWFLLVIPLAAFGQKPVPYFFHLDKLTVKENVFPVTAEQLALHEQNAFAQFQLNGYVGIQRKDSIFKRRGVHYYYTARHHFEKVKVVPTSGRVKKKKVFNHLRSASQAFDRTLHQLENNGFPFAQLTVVEQREKASTLELHYVIDSGNYYHIDDIHVKSNTKVHRKTLFHLMGLRPGDTYSSDKIKAIEPLLSNTGLYRLSRPVAALFHPRAAQLFVYLEKVNASSADGYIGFQQDPISRKLELNGYVHLKLSNALHRAETIDLQWRSNPNKTQHFNAKLSYPFLLNTPLGIGAVLDIRKQDSTFLRTDGSFRLHYYHPLFRFSLFHQMESSSLLRSSAASGFRNYRKNTVGTAFSIRPVRGLPSFYRPEWKLTAGVYTYRGDTIADNKQRMANSKYQLNYRQRIDLGRAVHVNTDVSFQGLTSAVPLSNNELLYFGGLNSVRGFYELELVGNDSWTVRNEWVFQPVELFAVFLLYDHASYRYNGARQANGFGVGMRLATDHSLVELIVANGKRDQNPIDFSMTKVHLGLKASF